MTERGSLLVSVVFLTAVAGLSAAALDVSSWYRTQRKLQSGADGAVLAGAQALPDNPSAARTLAGDGTVSFSTAVVPNDTITVSRKLSSPGVFSRMLGGSTKVEAKATARAAVPSKVRWASPLAVALRHPKLSGPGCPCWKQSAVIEARVLDLGSSGTEESWVREGYEKFMSPGWYSTKTTSAATKVRSALTDRVGSELLLPVYRERQERNGKSRYRVVGWTGFHLSGFDRATLRLRGWFERVIWDGTQGQSGPANDFGVRTIALID